MSRWWKCDLQVSTPGASDFKQPPESKWDLDSPEGRAAVADDFIAGVVAAGVEVIALAQHNSGEWIELLVNAGRRRGVYVFPGVEVTTASGADGAHLIIIGDQDRTEADIDALLAGPCGFNQDHPRLTPQGKPAPAPRTLPQILDDLPSGYGSAQTSVDSSG